MKKNIPLFLLCILPFLTSCASTEAYEVFAHVSVYEHTPIFISSPYNNANLLDWDGTTKAGVHFPVDPNHLGSQITEFESTVGTAHQIYTNTWILGTPPPETWLLELIALGRTPNIILTHGNDLAPFEINLLTETAQYLGKLHIPILLQLFPEARSHNYDPVGYVNFFRQARHIFNQYAPNVSLVFTLSEHDVLDAGQFYPGHDYVDIVAINIHKYITENGSPFNTGTMSRFNAFHQIYHHYKPLLVSFAVSHFSTINHVYHTHEAGMAIQNFYTEVIQYYPNIFAIVYKNFNSITYPSSQHHSDNFSVTENITVLEFYKTAIAHLTSTTPNNHIGLIKSPFNAVLRDGNAMLPLNSLVHDLGIDKNTLQQYIQTFGEEIQGNMYLSYDNLVELGFNLAIYKDYTGVVISY